MLSVLLLSNGRGKFLVTQKQPFSSKIPLSLAKIIFIHKRRGALDSLHNACSSPSYLTIRQTTMRCSNEKRQLLIVNGRI